jgi:hypothetical protein
MVDGRSIARLERIQTFDPLNVAMSRPVLDDARVVLWMPVKWTIRACKMGLQPLVNHDNTGFLVNLPLTIFSLHRRQRKIYQVE